MKSFNENIVQHIIHYLHQAKQRIWVNIPWFTHQELFQTLLTQASQGISVQLILQDDEINHKTSFRHDELALHGGKVYWFRSENSPTAINHEKYCLIDDKYIIYGSFNWTYNADQNNLESILVGEKPNANELIKNFENRFTEVLAHFFSTEPSPSHQLPTDIGYIYKLEISLLQNECGYLEAQIFEIETAYKNIEEYIRLHTGDLMLEKLNLELLLEEKKGQALKKKIYQETYATKKQEFETYKRLLENDQAHNSQIDQKAKEKKPEDIKQLYRELVKLIHPDKFTQNKELYEKANALMAKINKAYADNDMQELLNIRSMIENGAFANVDVLTHDYSLTELERMLEFWKKRKKELQEKLSKLKNHSFYAIFTNQKTIDEWVNELKAQIQTAIQTLQENLKHYKS